jgi:hypothetical protein
MHHTAALKLDGCVLCWGYKYNAHFLAPSDLENVVSISCGGHFVAAATMEGHIVCWGRNDDGECSVPDNTIVRVGLTILL